MQFFFLELLDGHAVRGHDARFHVLDLLVQIVVAIEEAGEMIVLDLEVGDQLSEFGEHSILLKEQRTSTSYVSIVSPSRFYDFDRHQAVQAVSADSGRCQAQSGVSACNIGTGAPQP
ncbi:hypothetical protein PSP6_970002 [Paraburkholderia tropica]|nr:hypothetical protein PSP6_970002 [Paraburkholderia tropica]